eukprot:502470_1
MNEKIKCIVCGYIVQHVSVPRISIIDPIKWLILRYYNFYSVSLYDNKRNCLIYNDEHITDIEDFPAIYNMNWIQHANYLEAINVLLHILNNQPVDENTISLKAMKLLACIFQNDIKIPQYLQMFIRHHASIALGSITLINISEFTQQYKLLQNFFVSKTGTIFIGKIYKFTALERLNIILPQNYLFDQNSIDILYEDFKKISSATNGYKLTLYYDGNSTHNQQILKENYPLFYHINWRMLHLSNVTIFTWVKATVNTLGNQLQNKIKIRQKLKSKQRDIIHLLYFYGLKYSLNIPINLLFFIGKFCYDSTMSVPLLRVYVASCSN